MSQKAPWRPVFLFQIVSFAVAVLKQRREADAALFSELHRKLQTQVGVFTLHGEDTYPVVYLLSSVDMSVLSGSTECPEAPLVRPLPTAESRRGSSQTIQQGEGQTANSCFLGGGFSPAFHVRLSCVAEMRMNVLMMANIFYFIFFPQSESL